MALCPPPRFRRHCISEDYKVVGGAVLSRIVDFVSCDTVFDFSMLNKRRSNKSFDLATVLCSRLFVRTKLCILFIFHFRTVDKLNMKAIKIQKVGKQTK